MGKTSIPWTDESSNPLKVERADGKRGWYCRKINPRCLHCYAAGMNERQGSNPGRHGTGHSFTLASAAELRPILVEKELDKIRRARKPRKWFVCDMTDIALQVGQCDVCGKWVESACSCGAAFPEPRFWPEEYVLRCFDAWSEAANNGQVIQLLTKRPRHLRRLLQTWRGFDPAPKGWWIGVSAGSQSEFEAMVEELGSIPAQTRFVSVEPQTEEIIPKAQHLAILDQVVQGGESGPGARPFHLEWMYTMRGACREAGTAWFPKQLGSNCRWYDPAYEHHPVEGFPYPTPRHRAGEDPRDWPEDLQGCREFPDTKETP